MDQPVEELAPARVSMHRRTLLKGAAWTVPAVLLVGTTPAFAQSASKLLVTGITASRAGEKVTFTLTLSNTNAGLVTLSDITFSTNSGWDNYAQLSTPDTFSAGSTSGISSFRARDADDVAPYSQLSFTLVDDRGASFNVNVTINAGSTDNPVTFSQS